MTTTSDGATEEPAALVEMRGHVLLLTLNRPRAMNAVNAAMTTLVADALERAEADREVRVVVVQGAGPKAFCAGADLKAVARGEQLTPPGYERFGFAGYVAHFISKPTIAAVTGFALGGGTEIALASDLVVAGEGAAFGLPEVKRGLFAGAGGAFRLPQQLPWKVGMELLLTGEPIDAATALRYGLVNRVVPDEDALDTALALAEQIAANAPLSVQTSKRLAYGAVDGTVPDDDSRWELNRQLIPALMGSADAQEGPRAFAEKRAPVWQGQ
ncbi:MAG TPA: crotonase/enoyl-CoA hydratase family protein [Mycobacteriales bacterium]|jgi:crotonobetainyl-CoA hydratase|nr:crotonase/enoyl-CoA hydratase family protein [Mycobacteriales bacterium]